MSNSNRFIHHLDRQLECSECKGSGCFCCDDRGVWYAGWYFWDEVQADRIGPYETEEEVERKFKEYCEQL